MGQENRAVSEVIGEVRARLRGSFTDVSEARQSLQAWHRISPHLGSIDPDDGPMLQAWCWDHLLAACRRALGTKDDEISVKKAVTLIRSSGDRLTASALAAHQQQHDHPGRDLGPLEDLVLCSINRLRATAGESAVGLEEPFGRRVAQWDLDRLKGLDKRVKDFATATVAHRLGTKVDPVSFDEMSAVLDTLSTAFVRWAPVFLGSSMDDNIAGLMAGRRLQAALATYDHQAHCAARTRATESDGTGMTSWWSDFHLVETSYHVRAMTD